MNLKEVLFRKGLRQVEIAKNIGCCPSAFNKFINGWLKLPKKYQDKLCVQLDVTPKELEKMLGKTVGHG